MLSSTITYPELYAGRSETRISNYSEFLDTFKRTFKSHIDLISSSVIGSFGRNLIYWRQLEEISNLGVDWDGYGALPLEKQSVLNTRKILEMMPKEFPVPDLTPNPNGTISLDWEISNIVISVEIGNSKFSAFLNDGLNGTTTHCGSFDSTNVFDLLVSMLSKYFQLDRPSHSALTIHYQ
jgi:hypothetical protein